MLNDPVFWLMAILSVGAQGLSKGGVIGLGVLGVPLLSLAMPPVQAAAVLLPILILQDWVSLFSYRRSIDRKVLLVPLAGGLAGTALGYALAARVNEGQVRLLVGIIALVFAVNWWIGFLRQRAAKAKPGPIAGIFWGLIAGFTSFVAHAGGPPYQVYSLPQRLPAAQLAGTSAWFFATLNLIKVGPYVMLGQFSGENLRLAAALAPFAIAATLLGVWLVKRIQTDPFYRIIYAILAGVGLILVWQGGRAILGL